MGERQGSKPRALPRMSGHGGPLERLSPKVISEKRLLRELIVHFRHYVSLGVRLRDLHHDPFGR